MLALVVLLVTPAAAGPSLTVGGHGAGSLVMGNGKRNGAPARAGLAGGIDLELGDVESRGAVALVLERLWRHPDAYADAHEDSLTVEYRHHIPNRAGNRDGYLAFGAGVRRVDSADALGGYRLRGYDVRIQGAFQLNRQPSPIAIRLRVGLLYGCYPGGTRDDGGAIAGSCLETFMGQMVVGLELARRL